VLIHAFPLNARMWEPQLELADLGWHVVAPQLRQFDGESGDPAAASVDDYASDIVDLLDALHIERAVIGGVSMGGYVTFALFRQAARYFQAMVLADTRPQADTAEGVENRQRMLQVLGEKGPAAVADEMLPKLVGDTSRRSRPDAVNRVRALMLTSSAGAIAGAITAMMTRPDSTALLPTIGCPTLVVVGDEDTITPPSIARELHRDIAGSDLVVVPGAGHLPSVEEPALFNAALARFLEHRV
jgi:pimeloyl-ACP methyl ester carboxylesterase